ncbi:MAG: protein kinase [Planctomycetota bacterium]
MMTATECPRPDQLKLFAVGRLGEVESEQVFEHLRHCDECQSQLETVDDDEDSLLGELRSADEPDPFADEPDCRVAIAKALGSLASAGADLADLPRELGDYELIRPIARGGMGEVYLARHKRLGREVAIKVISGARSSDSRSRERFEAEMRAVGRLSHPNIVAALDARDVDGVAVLVTEYVDGLDLGELVSRVGPLSTADACEIVRKVAAALQYTSDQGFVHRDVKPSNIMVSRDGEVKLLDLGLARLSEADERSVDLTATGQAIGTADYVAPEQVTDGRSVDRRADIYSLGCTLFKLLTGHAPFADERHTTAYAKMNAHVSSEPPRLSDHGEWPTKLVKLVESMLAKDVQRRPQEPHEVAAAVNGLVEGHDLVALHERAKTSEPKTETMLRSSTPKAMPWFRRRVPMSALIATGMLGLLFGVLFGLFIKITYPDGTTVVLPLDGAQLEVTKDDPTPSETRVFELSHLGAREVVATLKRLLGDEKPAPVVEGDPTTNTVRIRGSKEEIALISRLLEELDRQHSATTVDARGDTQPKPVRDMLSMFDGFWQLSGSQSSQGKPPSQTLSGEEVILSIHDGRVLVAAYRDSRAELIAMGEVIKKAGSFRCAVKDVDGVALDELWISRSATSPVSVLSLAYPTEAQMPFGFTQSFRKIGPVRVTSGEFPDWVASLEGRRVLACVSLLQAHSKNGDKSRHSRSSSIDGIWQPSWVNPDEPESPFFSAKHVIIGICDGRISVAAIRTKDAELIARGQVVEKQGELFAELNRIDQSLRKTMPIVRTSEGNGNLRLFNTIERTKGTPFSAELESIGDYPKDDAAFQPLTRSLSKDSWLRDCLRVIKEDSTAAEVIIASSPFEGLWERTDALEATAYLAFDEGKWFGVGFRGEQAPELMSGSYQLDTEGLSPLAVLSIDGELSMAEASLGNETIAVSALKRGSPPTHYCRLGDFPVRGSAVSSGPHARAIGMLMDMRSRGGAKVNHSRGRLEEFTASKNKLRGIGVAMHVHQSELGSIPGSATHRRTDPTEKNKVVLYPMSWRVALLPYIGYPQIYDQYRSDEPWDGPNNRKLLTQMPECYRSPLSGDELPIGHTNYLGFANDDSALGAGQGETLRLEDVLDVPGETLLVVDAKKSVPWTKPEDLEEVLAEDLRSPLLMVMADGSVRQLETLDVELVKKLTTRNGGEPVVFPTD